MSQSGEGSPPDETGTHIMKEVSPSVDSVVNARSSILESLLWPNTNIPKGPERPEDPNEKVSESHQASYDQLSIFTWTLRVRCKVHLQVLTSLVGLREVSSMWICQCA